MARKLNSETSVLHQARDQKLAQINQLSDQITDLQHRQSDMAHEIESLDYALSVLDPNHVPLNARGGNGSVLLIDAQPNREEPKVVEEQAQAASAVAPVKRTYAKRGTGKKAKLKAAQAKTAAANTAPVAPEPVAVSTPKTAAKSTAKVASASSKSSRKSVAEPTAEAAAPAAVAKSAAPKKAASAKKSEAVPETAVKAAAEVSKAVAGKKASPAKAAKNAKNKEDVARSVVNGYMKPISPENEITAILQNEQDGLSVEMIAFKLRERHPLKNDEHSVAMLLRNRISSQLSHLIKKGLIQGLKRESGEGAGRMHYTLAGERVTPSRDNEGQAAEAEQSVA